MRPERRRARRMVAWAAWGLAVAGVAGAAGCGTSPSGPGTSQSGPGTSLSGPGTSLSGPAGSGGAASRAGSRIAVVAAENSWGSLVAQLGGDRVAVTSIIASPDIDPHEYEPTAADARAVAGARLVLINGVGYDPWASKLVAAEPDPGRRTLTVGDLVGIRRGGNPHRWYSPPDVVRVIDEITADLTALDPADASYFDQQLATYRAVGLSQYQGLIAEIKSRYAGTPVGASESIAAPMADALGLRLLTPATFLQAVSEGTEPTAADKATIDTQIRTNQIRAYLYNSQNSTPDVAAQVAEARAHGIPITVMTETLVPDTVTFQEWQVRQLRSLEQALQQAVGPLPPPSPTGRAPGSVP